MISIKPEVCGICGACVAICRQNALFLFNATLQVSGLCNGCNTCVNICPLGAIIPEQKKLKQVASGVMPDGRS
jgi:MinD superfamily P-loop ATPase